MKNTDFKIHRQMGNFSVTEKQSNNDGSAVDLVTFLRQANMFNQIKHIFNVLLLVVYCLWVAHSSVIF